MKADYQKDFQIAQTGFTFQVSFNKTSGSMINLKILTPENNDLLRTPGVLDALRADVVEIANTRLQNSLCRGSVHPGKDSLSVVISFWPESVTDKDYSLVFVSDLAKDLAENGDLIKKYFSRMATGPSDLEIHKAAVREKLNGTNAPEAAVHELAEYIIEQVARGKTLPPRK